MPEFLKIVRPDLANQTFNWMTPDTEEEYKKNNKITDVLYGPTDITYTYNNYGFRCDNFDSWENYPYRILFAGCSMTEGIGLPLQDSWAKQVHSMICERMNFNIPFWSVASAGAGIDHMVRYIYNIKDLLKPQIIISYLPDKVRRERWNEDRWSAWSLDLLVEKNTRIMLDERFIMYQTEKNLAMLNMILKELDCYFLYSSSMNDFKISDYVDSHRIIHRDHIPEQYDVARDCIHAGPKTNKIMAERAFEYFWPKIENKLGLT
jgi:hypothetical protein